MHQDVRGAARDSQRDKEHKAKWPKGAQPRHRTNICNHLPLGDGECGDCGRGRPPRQHGTGHTRTKRIWEQKNVNAKSTMARKVFHNEVIEATDAPLLNFSDTSGDEELYDESVAPVPDAEIMYSYDHTCGPVKGQDVLSSAITAAVARFENKETEKLVKEYDMVGDSKHIEEEEDHDSFEFIEHAHLN